MKKLPFIFLIGMLIVMASSYAYATERYGFETGTEGWVASDYQYGQAITSVGQSSDRAVVGTYSLKMNANLIGGSSTHANGEAYVDMRYNPPTGVVAPVDLQGQTVTAFVFCPIGSKGDPSKPNGIQIFVKDENWNSVYSSWVDIVENTWVQLSMLVNNTATFDATKVIVVGAKIGAGTGSTATYEGPIYLDVVSFEVGEPEQPSPENQRYDFETGMQGWVDSDYTYGQAVISVEQSSIQAALGTYSLRLNTDLIGSDTYKSEGEAYVDMRYSPPSGVTTPVNLNGVEVTAWVYCPSGSRGDPNNPNGIQIFVKDEEWEAEYSTWMNIFEEVWFKVTLIPSTTAPPNGHMDEGFDPTKIISVGVKIGAGTGSTATYNGPIYLDVYAFPQPGVPLSDYTYNFNDPGCLEIIPHWDIDPGWGAEAWDSVYLENNALAVDATFDTSTEATRKGFVNILYTPPIYLTNKDSHLIRAEVKFDPQPDPFDFVAVCFVYDKQTESWYMNDYKSIGGAAGWNVLTFDLDDNTAYDPDLPTGETMPLGQIVKVGIQIYANNNYTGKVYFDNITIGGEEITSSYPQENEGIVTTSGTQFVLNEKAFYFAGANAEYLFEKSVPIAESVLDSAEDMNLTVVRTWAFGEGESTSFQPERGKFNQSAFEQLDRMIAYAGVKGIRLIMPLVDNWGHYGGMYKYMDWVYDYCEENELPLPIDPDTGQTPERGTERFHDLFFINDMAKQWYKDYVTYLLDRTNTITGVQYKDDPNIFAWEVFNEPRCKSDVSGKRIHDWIVEMSAFVESLDPNHMIGSGEEGSYIMTKASADAFTWQDYPQNYWEYGVNYSDWGSNGADFISDHKSTDTTVSWQENYGGEISSDLRTGVPNIDYCSFRTYIDYREFNLYSTDPVDQSLKWAEQHMNDALNVIGKPVIMEEFGIHTVGYIYWGGFGEIKFHRTPAYTYADRRNIFAKYYDYIYNHEIGGSFFWNLGYEGMREDLFDGCESLTHDEYATWQIDTNSDATSILVSSSYFTQGDYSLRGDYSYTPERGKAYYDLPNLSEKWEITEANPPETGAINRAKFMLDIYNAGDVQYVDVVVCTGPSQIWHESEMQAVSSGWNTIVVDLSSETWKTEASGWQNNVEIADLDDVRKIAIGLFGYSGTGSVYMDNIRIFEDDGFVIYPGDRITSIISAHAENMSKKPDEQRWMLHLPVPWYKEESIHYSAAASCQMMLDYLGNYYSQDTLYEYGHSHNSPENSEILEIDPQGVWETLMNYMPSGYYFGIRSMSDVNSSLRDICYWIDYEVPSVEPKNVPATVPTFGGYDNWMVVRGASTSADPSSATGEYTVYGFWINDPAVSGLGADSYKTASEFVDTYFKALTTGDTWDGRYVSVAEPPPSDSYALVKIGRREIKNRSMFATLCQSLESQNSLNITNWEEVLDPALLGDSEFMACFQGTVAREPLRVRRLDRAGCDYYLVPFNRASDNSQKELTQVVLALDVNTGLFKEATWTKEPVKFLKVSKSLAIKMVKRVTSQFRAHTTAQLIWRPGKMSTSSFKPIWQVDIAGQTWYVNQNKQLFGPPRALPGGPYAGYVNKNIHFRGNGMPYGSEIVEYFWDFKDGTTSTLQNPVHRWERAGRYTVNLKVKDEEGNWSEEARCLVIVKPRQAAFHIKGQIKDRRGRPLKSVKVILWGRSFSKVRRWRRFWRRPIYKICYTDRNGFYQFKNLKSGYYQVIPRKWRFRFIPPYRIYRNLRANRDNQNFRTR